MNKLREAVQEVYGAIFSDLEDVHHDTESKIEDALRPFIDEEEVEYWVVESRYTEKRMWRPRSIGKSRNLVIEKFNIVRLNSSAYKRLENKNLARCVKVYRKALEAK